VSASDFIENSSVFDEPLFQRFEDGGFQRLTEMEIDELVALLDQTAASTDRATPLFLSQAVMAVRQVFRQHEEYGGVSVAFLNYLDKVVLLGLAKIRSASPSDSGKLARQLRDEVVALLSEYDPSKPGGL